MLQKLLFDHPREIGESYGEHACHALWIALRMVAAGLACLVHAVIPGLFVHTATQAVEDITNLMQNRKPIKPGKQSIERAPG